MRTCEEDIMATRKGPRHTPYVLLAIAAKPKSFNEIENATNIPPSTLSRSLKILIKSGMIKARALTSKEEGKGGGLWKYELTDKGDELRVLAEYLEEASRNFWDKVK